ncbi:MAG: alpha/beta hydrolase [Candidatus Delongbacteria bacterium]|nr:alpha/beta hydrolase [Candidatus Delongbacteria bacterium]
MYVITNRELKNKKGLDIFGKVPNPCGPLELRIVEVIKKGKTWQTSVTTDKLPQKKVKAIKKKFNLDIDETGDWYASLRIACELFERAQKEKKSILFFVHGYNNDVEDVMKVAEDLEKTHGVIVVPFTWPANGGGAVTGTLAYKSDKSDARASEGALNRAVGKLQYFHTLFVSGHKKILQAKANQKHKNNYEAAQALFSKLMSIECSTTINLLCHSMGNYVLKKTLLNGGNSTSQLVFDNVCLVAADTNNNNHANWVENLDVRNRVYIVINENDFALRASRIKPGEEQKARLGHYVKKLNSDNAHYINVTDVDKVDKQHSYFVGDSMKNVKLKTIFTGMFNGQAIENQLNYQSDTNTYVL